MTRKMPDGTLYERIKRYSDEPKEAGGDWEALGSSGEAAGETAMFGGAD